MEQVDSKSLNSTESRRQKRKKLKSNVPQSLFWNREIAIGGLVTSFLLLPLFFEYISNMTGDTSTLTILWSSLTRVGNNSISYGVLALVFTTWVASSILFAPDKQKSPWKSFVAILIISGGIVLCYGLFLSGSLARIARNIPTSLDDVLVQATSFENLIPQFYLFMIMGLLLLGGLLPTEWPRRYANPSSFGVIIAPVVLILVISVSYFTNLRIIQADISFKLADPFSSSGQWPVANILYQRAKDYAPDEDYYDLFLGRGYLEHAKTVSDNLEKQSIFEQAEADLKKAQTTNPLNPDHTANLARLYSWWASQTNDSEERLTRGLNSNAYYQRVIVLSPNNARLWAEWASLNLDILQQPERGIELLNKALEIDPEYDWANAILGNYYMGVARLAKAPDEKEKAFQSSIKHYREAIEYSKNLNYFFALASVYQSMNDLDGLIDVLKESLEYTETKNDIWKIEENLAVASFQLQRINDALKHAQNALAAAPESEQERLHNLIRQIEGSP